MTEEDRQKLCADLRNPWAVTIEELAELAGVAAGAIEALAEECIDLAEQLAIKSESGMAKDMQAIMKINNELKVEIERLNAELEHGRNVEPAPASVVRWWARSKRESAP
jgi:plasmid maintenance system antidote protein VapI